MRAHATVLHLDLDAFFASVEQRDKPSLRGKPVMVGGTGPRGVISTASYEARVYGVRSAMSSAEAHRRCPHGAYLSGRFGAYRAASKQVMGLLRELGVVEQLSIDEAYVDLAGRVEPTADNLLALGQKLRADVVEATEGLTASVGIGTSKLMAKIGSELAKPDGIRLIEPGTEVATLAALPARAIPGIGPSTMERLERLGVQTVRDIQLLTEAELVRELGRSWGAGLHQLVFGVDDRPIESSRETKSISTERTYVTDQFARHDLEAHLVRDATELAERAAKARLFARTVTLKVRFPDFTTFTRSKTLPGSTDSADVFAAVGIELLATVDLRPGVRLLGLGVSNFTEAAQEPLFWDVFGNDQAGMLAGVISGPGEAPALVDAEVPGGISQPVRTPWRPGVDVVHDEYGPGWVWGSGLGRVTVRFETRHTPPGSVRTFAVDDPALHEVRDAWRDDEDPPPENPSSFPELVEG